MKLTSSAFIDGGVMPAAHTCDGANVSPPLAWDQPPAGTLSLALVMDDPDSPAGVWVHWVLFNMPPSLRGLQEGVTAAEALANGALQGLNDAGRTGYYGSCPHAGEHRYSFRLYALDCMLTLPMRAAKKQLEEAMNSHILAEAALTGRYRRRV